jgi:hypothetical protein
MRMPRPSALILLIGVALFTAPVLRAQQNPPAKPAKIKAAAIRVDMVESNEIKLPAEFQVSLYEDLIQQLQKKGGFHIYREGDRSSENAADLVILHTTVRGFKQGSERVREVTTVAGTTSIDVHCAFTDKNGTTLLERDIQGNVHFFGGNLRATYDFAKKAAQATRDSFSPTGS